MVSKLNTVFVIANTKGGSGKTALACHVLMPALLSEGKSPFLIQINCSGSISTPANNIHSIDVPRASSLRRDRRLQRFYEDFLIEYRDSPHIVEIGSGIEFTDLCDAVIDHSVFLQKKVEVWIPFTDCPPHINGIEKTLEILDECWQPGWNGCVKVKARFIDRMNTLDNVSDDLDTYCEEIKEKYEITFLPPVHYSKKLLTLE